MHKPLILIVLLLGSSFAVLDASSVDITIDETVEETPRQQAINYIPFKEIVTVVIDKQNDITNVSYSLLSKDKEDFQIPDSFEAKILNIEKITSIIYTNEKKCAPGIYDDRCILVNVLITDLTSAVFKEKQKEVREIGNSVIDDINQILGTNAKYHSVVVQTSGDPTGQAGITMSAVYTMKNLSTLLLFNNLILENVSEEIRFGGGFFNHAKMLSLDENSTFTFAMTTEKNRMLYTTYISVTTLDNEIDLNNLSLLDLLHENKLDRSKLYTDGFYPLNSIVRIVIYSEEALFVKKTSSEIIGETSNAEGFKKHGWYYIKGEQMPDGKINRLDLRYLFGETYSVDKQQLLLTISPVVEDVTPDNVSVVEDVTPDNVSQSILPVGVKSPAPNFERAIDWTITELYEEIGSPKKNYTYTWGMELVRSMPIDAESNFGVEFPDGAKIIKGDGTELLVFSLLITNNGDTSVTYYLEHSKMYDGKDRVFDSLTHEIENPTSWSENCPVDPVVIQPGLGQLLKLCFEIPKDSDHFKIVTLLPTPNVGITTSSPASSTELISGYFDVVAVFDRLGIGEDALPQPDEETNQGGGCLIATAAFGSEMAPQVQFLRELRDNTVLQTESGTSFMTGFNQFYYSFSPYIADYERENPAFKEVVKLTLTPLLTSLTLLQYTDIDSESEMLGYGVGIILLNIGMYFVAPTVLIMKIRKLI